MSVAKPTVLLLAYNFPPDETSGSLRTGRFYKFLSRLGHRVIVVTAHPGSAVLREGDVWKLPGRTVYPHPPGIASLAERIARKTLLPYDEGVLWSLRVARFQPIADLLPSGPLVLLSSAPPFTVHWAALCWKRRLGVPWIADFRDPLLGNPYRAARVAAWVDPLLQRRFFQAADLLIANTEDVLRAWQKTQPSLTPKFRLLWNGFDPEDSLTSLPPLGATHRLLTHVGAIYLARNPLFLLESLDRLYNRGQLTANDLRVHLLGPIAGDTLLTSPAVQRLRTNGLLLLENTKVPAASARQLTASSDYLLLLDTTEGAVSVQVPAKLFEYARIGRPILACTMRGSPAERILAQSGLTYQAVYPDLPDNEVDARLLRFLRLPPMTVSPNAWFLSQFDGARQAEALSAMIESLSP